MKKRGLNLLAFVLFGSLIATSCSNGPITNRPSGYETYSVYRLEGGNLSYWEWIEAGRLDEVDLSKESIDKRTIVSKHFDQNGHLILVLSDGSSIDAGTLDNKRCNVSF